MHGSVFLDGDGKVIRPALLWNDQRTAAECAEIENKAGGREALVRMVANPALTGFTAPKLLWLRNHEPLTLGPGPAGPPAQGLHPLPAHRDVRHRGQRRLGDAAARRRQPPLEQGAARASSRSTRRCFPRATRAPRSRPRSATWGRRRRAWPRGRRSSAAAATSRPAPSATGSSGRASSRRRWGPRASSSHTPRSSASTRSAGSSAAATRCRAPGTSWASCSRPAAASSGSATSWARPRSRWPASAASTPTSS